MYPSPPPVQVVLSRFSREISWRTMSAPSSAANTSRRRAPRDPKSEKLDLVALSPVERARWMVTRAQESLEKAPAYAVPNLLRQLQAAVSLLQEEEARPNEAPTDDGPVDPLALVLELVGEMAPADVEEVLCACEGRLKPGLRVVR